MLLRVLIFVSVLRRGCLGDEDTVAEYTDANFDSKIGHHDTAMVMFYAPWCGHCKHLKPEFSKAAEDLSQHDPPVALAKVDCTDAGKGVCDRFDVDGYPTLKVFKGGSYLEDYKGPRTKEGIVEFMRAQAGGKKARRLTGAEEVADFTGGGGGGEEVARVVGYFDAGTRFEEEFGKVVDALWLRTRFAYCDADDREIEEGLAVHLPPRFRNRFEEDVAIYRGAADAGEMRKFVEEHRHGLLGYRTSTNEGDFPLPLAVAYYTVDYKLNPKGTNYWRNRLLKVAKEFKGKFRFAFSSKEEFPEELNEYGMENVKEPSPIIMAISSDGKKYLMDDLFSCDNLTNFLVNLLENKLKPKVLRSESVPLENAGSAKVAVTKNFKEMVLDNGKDTVLMLYDPLDDSWEQLQSEFEQLAEKLKEEEVEVVKMDVVSNEAPEGFVVEKIPLVYWMSKEDKFQFIIYKGVKKLEGLLKFVAEHASKELQSFDRKGNVKVDWKKEEL